eukprot:CAMPEP_0168608352 /NCGR_PEP_ID=MMETSP0449_2-20121227/579_1 /TAXON_ID=1082188 /ORGANISM="Strombidium rassoulzadegani, Strain ras09" /LENGTH=52 /DNA_ID=CAMNT_0008648327 /DNA_START=43 /DNA_END=201 /DNA_ORIENTATION=+
MDAADSCWRELAPVLASQEEEGQSSSRDSSEAGCVLAVNRVEGEESEGSCAA